MFWIFKIKKCKSAGNTSPNINLEKAGEIIAELFVKKMYSGMSETEVKNVIFANTRMQPTKEKEQKFEGKKTKGIFYGDDVMFTFIQIPDTGNYALIGVSVGKESYIAKPRYTLGDTKFLIRNADFGIIVCIFAKG